MFVMEDVVSIVELSTLPGKLSLEHGAIRLPGKIEGNPARQGDLLLLVVLDGKEGVPGSLESDSLRKVIRSSSHDDCCRVISAGWSHPRSPLDSDHFYSEVQSLPRLSEASWPGWIVLAIARYEIVSGEDRAGKEEEEADRE